MRLKNFLLTIFTIFINPTFAAAPPFEVLRSCIDINPYNDQIVIKRLEGAGMAEKSMEGCEDQYDRLIDGHVFGTLTCNEKFYFVINDKKYDPELAKNYSINPEIKPGVEFSKEIWYKIDYEKKAYLCIYASLSDSGIGAAYNQYYIIENAFDKNPELYYYFFEKNIVPITSKTL